MWVSRNQTVSGDLGSFSGAVSLGSSPFGMCFWGVFGDVIGIRLAKWSQWSVSKAIADWWWLEHEFKIFPIFVGMIFSNLTFTPSFFRGVGQPPTRNRNRRGISDDFSAKYRESVDSLPRQRKTSREVPEVPRASSERYPQLKEAEKLQLVPPKSVQSLDFSLKKPLNSWQGVRWFGGLWMPNIFLIVHAKHIS